MKLYLKYVLNVIIEQLLKLTWTAPLKKNRILFLSFAGSQYSDSPKYVYEYMKDRFSDYEYVWAFNEPEKFKWLESENCRVIHAHGKEFIKYFTSSKVIVTNNAVNSYLPVRKNQVVLNTWHGGGVGKKVGFSANKPDPYNKYYFKAQNKKYKAYITSSKYLIKTFLKEGFHYNGEILRFGLPRNSILFGDHEPIVRKVREHFGISESAKIIMYAPTFRGDFRNSSFITTGEQIDFERVMDSFRKKFGTDCVLFFRAHYTMKQGLVEGNFIDATDYPDMQELLCAADVLISDYSSCIHDMALMYKPVFLYVPDYREYEESPGFCLDIKKWPYPFTTDNGELNEAVLRFDEEKYKKRVKRFMDFVEDYDSKDSLKMTVDWIIRNMK